MGCSALCPFAMTCTACNCLRAYGIERDYVVLLSFLYVMGASPAVQFMGHPRHVTGVKSCEPGAYYVSLFFVLGTVVSQPVLGCAALFDGGTTFGFIAGCPA